MSDDRERLERYLEWQRAQDKHRLARRRRWMIRAVAAAVLGVVAAGLGAWLVAQSTHARGRVAIRPGSATPVDIAPPVDSAPAEPPRLAPPEPPPAPRPTLRAGRHAPRRSSARPAPTRAGHLDSPEVAAGIAPSPPPPAPVMPTAPPLAAPEPRVTPRAPVAPEPGATETPDLPAVVAEPAPPPSAPPKVSERVTRWLEGEVQEFRDGVRREIDDARSGYDALRRGVRQLRSRIRGE